MSNESKLTSEIDWANDEAVCKAAIVGLSLGFKSERHTCGPTYFIVNAAGDRISASSFHMRRPWGLLRAAHPSVAAFEQQHRPSAPQDKPTMKPTTYNPPNDICTCLHDRDSHENEDSRSKACGSCRCRKFVFLCSSDSEKWKELQSTPSQQDEFLRITEPHSEAGEKPKRSLAEVLEELCPGVGRRNGAPTCVNCKLPWSECHCADYVQPKMTTDEDDIPEAKPVAPDSGKVEGSRYLDDFIERPSCNPRSKYVNGCTYFLDTGTGLRCGKIGCPCGNHEFVGAAVEGER